MNKETRIQKIQEIVERDKNNPFGRQEIHWEDRLVPMEVYKIPLDYLVYNKYNGRILSRTKSLERRDCSIEAETDKGKRLIEKLLWNSKPDRNKKTHESIEEYGQKKIGIITKDGIIIDGNRRAMLLNKIDKFDYFKAVVLPVTLEEKPLEIEKLETSYQMGEDEKLGYPPIEKYLKSKDLYIKLNENRLYEIGEVNEEAIKKISDWIGESRSTIKEYLEVMTVMDDYLDYLGYNGIYTQLDGREDQFINLMKWLNNFYGEGSIKAFDGYKNSDVDDLKIISFDYIRTKYEGKKFRYIADGLKENHFFGNKSIWSDFKDYHFNNISIIKDKEKKIDFDFKNLEAYLNDRDTKFEEKSIKHLNENIDSCYQQLRYKKSADEPKKLVSDAKRALEAINQTHESFSTPEVLDQLESVNQMTSDILKNKSPKRLLTQVLSLLKKVNIENAEEEREEMLEEVSKINKVSFEMKKYLGG